MDAFAGQKSRNPAWKLDSPSNMQQNRRPATSRGRRTSRGTLIVPGKSIASNKSRKREHPGAGDTSLCDKKYEFLTPRLERELSCYDEDYPKLGSAKKVRKKAKSGMSYKEPSPLEQARINQAHDRTIPPSSRMPAASLMDVRIPRKVEHKANSSPSILQSIASSVSSLSKEVSNVLFSSNHEKSKKRPNQQTKRQQSKTEIVNLCVDATEDTEPEDLIDQEPRKRKHTLATSSIVPFKCPSLPGTSKPSRRTSQRPSVCDDILSDSDAADERVPTEPSHPSPEKCVSSEQPQSASTVAQTDANIKTVKSASLNNQEKSLSTVSQIPKSRCRISFQDSSSSNDASDDESDQVVNGQNKGMEKTTLASTPAYDALVPHDVSSRLNTKNECKKLHLSKQNGRQSSSGKEQRRQDTARRVFGVPEVEEAKFLKHNTRQSGSNAGKGNQEKGRYVSQLEEVECEQQKPQHSSHRSDSESVGACTPKSTLGSNEKHVSKGRKPAVPIIAGKSIRNSTSSSSSCFNLKRPTNTNKSTSNAAGGFPWRETGKQAEENEWGKLAFSKVSRTRTLSTLSGPSTRRFSSMSKKVKDQTPIDLVDSSSEDESVKISPLPRHVKTRNRQNEPWNVLRIAIGETVHRDNCEVVLCHPGVFEIRYSVQKRRIRKKFEVVKIELANIQELHYRRGEDGEDDKCMSFLSIKTESAFPIRYLVEFRSNEDLDSILNEMKQIDETAAALLANATGLDENEIENHAQCFVNDSKNENSSRRSTRSKSSSSSGGGHKEDVMLVFPFDGDLRKIEEAANGLVDVKGPQPKNSLASLDTNDDAAMTDIKTENKSLIAKAENRRHYLTMQVKDHERLNPGEFLNDTLIDFWMQWISRKADQSARIHSFSTHFFTTLHDEGPEAVEKWTAKKDINVFSKKFIFIPVNEALHWSLCVVVQPGAVTNNEDVGPRSCLLFLDSLRAHKKRVVAMKIRQWLASEWKRLNPSNVATKFDNSNFRMFSPKIPYQTNYCDCGVFVCRYATAMYSLVDEEFSKSDDWYQKSLMSKREFDFDGKDVERLREQMQILIERLSAVYCTWIRQGKYKLKEEKDGAKEGTHSDRTNLGDDLTISEKLPNAVSEKEGSNCEKTLADASEIPTDQNDNSSPGKALQEQDECSIQTQLEEDVVLADLKERNPLEKVLPINPSEDDEKHEDVQEHPFDNYAKMNEKDRLTGAGNGKENEENSSFSTMRSNELGEVRKTKLSPTKGKSRTDVV